MSFKKFSLTAHDTKGSFSFEKKNSLWYNLFPRMQHTAATKLSTLSKHYLGAPHR